MKLIIKIRLIMIRKGKTCHWKRAITFTFICKIKYYTHRFFAYTFQTKNPEKPLFSKIRNRTPQIFKPSCFLLSKGSSSPFPSGHLWKESHTFTD